MRLWHWKMLPYLPKSQLVSQWRELNSIYKKQDNHILINYIYEYDKKELFYYSIIVLKEMKNRNIKVNSLEKFNQYFECDFKSIDDILLLKFKFMIFNNHHNKKYLLQCFMNLSEKYFAGQIDFNKQTYNKLRIFVNNELNGLLDIINKYV